MIKYIITFLLGLFIIFNLFKTNTLIKYKARPYRIINCCKKYHLEDNLEELAFNRRFSNPKLRWVLRTKYNYTKRFLRSIRQRLRNDSNIIIVIWGSPNSGKSEVGMFIGLFIKTQFYIYLSEKIEFYYAFSTADFNTILTKMEPGDIGIRDESSKLSGMGSINVQKYLDNVTRLIRANQNSFIFIDPTLIKPDVVSFYLETAGKNYTKRRIRCILYDKNKDYLGHVYIPLHWWKRFRLRYLQQKKENIQTIMANAGMVTPEIDPIRLERDIKKLTEHCRSLGITKKGEIFGIIPRYNGQFNPKTEKHLMIKGDTNYIPILVANVCFELRQGYSMAKEKKKEMVLSIRYKDGQSFSDFVRKNMSDEKVARVAMGLARGDSYNTIMSNNTDISYYFIQNTSDWLRNKANTKFGLGYLFEKWYALSIGVPKDKLDEVLGGTSDRPDLIWENIIYSIKFRIAQKVKTMTFTQSVSLGPAYREAKQRNTKYKLVFLNPVWGPKVQIIDIDPFKDSEEIKVKRPSTKRPLKKLIMD